MIKGNFVSLKMFETFIKLLIDNYNLKFPTKQLFFINKPKNLPGIYLTQKKKTFEVESMNSIILEISKLHSGNDTINPGVYFSDRLSLPYIDFTDENSFFQYEFENIKQIKSQILNPLDRLILCPSLKTGEVFLRNALKSSGNLIHISIETLIEDGFEPKTHLSNDEYSWYLKNKKIKYSKIKRLCPETNILN